MRLFIAIDFNELRKELTKLQNNMDESVASLKKVEAFHLTLKFLGKTSLEKADQVKEKLKEIKFSPFKLTLDKIGFFPKENYVKVIWIGVKPQEETIKLQEKIENGLMDFKKDFKFHPHITLARVQNINDRENFIKNLKEIRIEEKTIEVKDFRLVKSNLTPKGPVYQELESYALE